VAVPAVRPVASGFAKNEAADPVALAAARIEEQLRATMRERRLDPFADRSQLVELVTELVDHDQELSFAAGNERELSLAVRILVERRLVESITGFGPLQPYLDDPVVEEIWISERLTGGLGCRGARLAPGRCCVGAIPGFL